MEPSTGRAAIAWAMGAVFFLYAFVQRVAPSVMVDDLMRDFGVGAAAIGNLSAFYFYAYVIMQMPVGVLMDRIGPRRLMTAAAAVAALGSVIFAASPVFLAAGAGRFLIGLGVAASWIGLLMLATQSFPAHRFALLAGIGQAMGMAGAIVGQAPLGELVTGIGWRRTATVLAAVGLLIALGIWLSARDGARRAPQGHLLAGLARVARTAQSWAAAALALSLTAPMLSFAGLWAVPFFGSLYGMSRAEAAALTSTAFLGWAVGAPALGWLADRIGRRKPLLLAGTGGLGITTAAVVYLPLPPWGTAAALFLGGVAGAAMILTYGAARAHNAPEDAGATYGFVNTATVGSGALFQPLLGVLLDAAWDGTVSGGVRVYGLDAYRLAFAVLPAMSALGFLAALALRERPRAAALT
jgi:MFS family permease